MVLIEQKEADLAMIGMGGGKVGFAGACICYGTVTLWRKGDARVIIPLGVEYEVAGRKSGRTVRT